MMARTERKTACFERAFFSPNTDVCSLNNLITTFSSHPLSNEEDCNKGISMYGS
jgi:hypothetical protein